MPDRIVVLWVCPVCGRTAPDTSQRSRTCGWTRACSNTPMERWKYAPVALEVTDDQ